VTQPKLRCSRSILGRSAANSRTSFWRWVWLIPSRRPTARPGISVARDLPARFRHAVLRSRPRLSGSCLVTQLGWNPIMPPDSFVCSYAAPQSGQDGTSLNRNVDPHVWDVTVTGQRSVPTLLPRAELHTVIVPSIWNARNELHALAGAVLPFPHRSRGCAGLHRAERIKDGAGHSCFRLLTHLVRPVALKRTSHPCPEVRSPNGTGCRHLASAILTNGLSWGLAVGAAHCC